MAAGITARQYTNNAVFTAGTKYFQVDANSIVGTAEDLIAVALDVTGGSLPSSILLSNRSAATVYIRPASMAAATGVGIAISSMGSMFFPLTAVPTDGIYVETTAPINGICFE